MQVLARLTRTALATALSLSLALPPAFAGKGTYVFRYNSGFVSINAGEPEVPSNPDQYDVTARFFGVKDQPFEARIPTKPGAHVVSWKIEKGTLPAGLSLDEATGTISGTPTETADGRSLSVRGYAPSGAMGTYASVKIDLVQVGSYARQQIAYGHTGKTFHVDLAKPSGVTVYTWTPETPTPDWMTVVNGMLSGTPQEAGTWPLAFSGLDYSGREVAFAYGQIVVEDGPQVAFIADETHHRDQDFHAAGRVAYKLGELRWELEGVRPRGLAFRSEEGVLEGNVPTFDTSLAFRLKAIDTDGTSGLSNWFSFTTLPAELALDDVPTQHLTLNKAGGFSFRVTDTAGTQDWSVVAGTLPDGMSIDPSTGRVSGTPTKTGTWPGVVVQLTDASGSQQSNAFDVVVDRDHLTASVDPTDARIGTPFTGRQPSPSGGEAPYTYALADGSSLPEGVTLDAATGVLSGTLSETGEQSPILTAVDSTGHVGSPFAYGLVGYGPLSASIGQPEYVAERLSPAKVLPTVAEYTAMPPFSWSLSPASPPPGMSLDISTGAVAGTPTSVGTYGPYALTIHDASGATASTAPFTVKVEEIPDIEIQSSDKEIERMISVEVSAGKPLHAVGQTVWELDPSSAALPSGLRLDPDGAFRGRISATAPVPGVVVRVTDSEGRSGSSSPFSIVPVAPKPMEMAAAELTWPAGFAFTAKIEPSNPAGEWTAAASGLPAWLSLDPETGSLAGTAPAEGTYGPYQVTATDEMERTATASFTLTATGPLALSLQSPVDIHRLETVSGIGPAASNAVGSVSWSLSGTPPKGLAFDASSGSLSGTATAEGTSSVTFTARDGANQVASLPVTISVGPRQPLSVAYSLPTFHVGSSTGLPVLPQSPTNAALPATFSASGPLPAGLTLDATNGAIGGVPSQAGLYEGLSISARDAEGETASSGPLSIRIEPQSNILVRSPVERAMRLDAYAQTSPIAVENAVPPLSFTTGDGSPLSDPDGLVLAASTGSLSGVPHTPGERFHSLKVTDSMGRTASFSLKLNVVGDLSVSMADVSANRYAPLPASVAPAVANAVGTATYSISPASLPAGLSFNASNGRLSGAPENEGTYGPFTLSVQDSTGQTASDTFSVIVGPRLALSAAFPAASTNAIAHQSFSTTPKAVNAIGTVSWALQSGDLPEGLSLDSQTGQIRGTPVSLGTTGGIVLVATDSTGATAATPALSITVALNGQPISLVTKKLTWKQGMAFSTAVPTVANEIGDIFFRSPQAEALGLTVDPATGVISGTVAEPGTYVVDLNVTDSTNRVTSEPVTLDLMPRLRLTAKPIYATVSQSLPTTKSATAEYAIGPVTYALQGALPMGVSLQTNGYLTGTPTQLGLFENIVVTATDSTGDTATSNPFTFEVLDNGKVPTITAMPAIPVLKVGTAMAAVTPAVSFKKPGDDVYTLNKPLPDGLVLDPATGRISGTPALGSQGIYDGYVLSVADSLDRGTSTDEFAIKIRHQLNPVLTVTPSTVYYRVNVPFTAPVPTLTNTEAFIGTPVFSITGTTAGLTVDPVTGVISGTISTNRAVTLAVSDDIGQVTTRSVSLNSTSLQFTFSSQTLTEGQAVDYMPVTNLPSAEARYSWASQVEGVLPQGLSMDQATGRVTGTMPFGTYFLKATLTDSGTTVLSPTGTTYAKWVGKSSVPLSEAVSFAPLTEQDNGALVESNIVPITQLASAVNASAVALDGGIPQIRTCYDANCLQEKSTWSTALHSVDNGEFVQLRIGVSNGSLQTYRVSLNLSGGAGAGIAPWSVTSKEREGLVDASTVLPQSVFLGETTPLENWQDLYDGDGNGSKYLSGNSYVTYDFGKPVSFSSYYVKKSSTSSSFTHYLMIDGPDGWETVHQTTSTGQFDLGKTVVAQKIRLKLSNYANTIYDFRIGTGGAHRSPTLVAATPLATLSGSQQSIQLSASAYDSAYVSGNGLTFAKVSGNLPAAATLSPDGRLSLPSRTEAGAGNWRFTVRATDNAGFATEMEYFLFSPGADAATVMPTSVAPAADVFRYYDGKLESVAFIGNGYTVTLNFDRYVTFDSVYLYASREGRVEVDVDGKWVTAMSVGASAGAGVRTGTTTWTTKSVRFVNTNYTYSASVYEFRVGAGPALAPPVFNQGTMLADIQSSASSVQIDANAAQSPYLEGNALTYAIIAGALPPGATMDSHGLLELPSKASTGAGSWAFTVRATDAFGYIAEKQFIVNARGVPAASVFPVSMTATISQDTMNKLYDGSVSSVVAYLDTARSVTLNYGQYVDFNSYYAALSNVRSYKVEALVGGQWIPVSPSTNASGLFQLNDTWTAKLIKITGTESNYGYLSEFRLGNGPSVAYPAFVQAEGSLADLGDTAFSVHIEASVANTPYVAGNEATFSIVAGALPPDSNLAADGTLSLPAKAGVAGTWLFTVRATDKLGFASDRQFLVNSRGADAATKMPVSATPITADKIPLLYDGVTTASVANIDTSPSRWVTLDFGEYVSFDRFYIANATSSGVNFKVEAFIGGEWVLLKSDTLAGGHEYELGTTWTAKFVRISSTTNYYFYLSEFRLGQ